MNDWNFFEWFKQQRILICYEKWYVIDSQTAKDRCNQNNYIEFEIESIKSSFCDYSDVFILVTRDIALTTGNNTDAAFKNFASFSICQTEINDAFIDVANYIYIAMPMYNMIECSDSYSDTSGSLWQFIRDEVPNNNADLTIDNCQSFKYKAALVEKTADAVNNKNTFVKNAKIIVPCFWDH